MLLSFSLLGIILSVILVSFNARKSYFSIFLGAFFFLVGLYALIEYAVFYSKSIWLVSIVFINVGFLTYLIGPVLFLYVRSLLTDSLRLKKSDLLHLLPMMIFFIGTLSYMLTPWAFKKEIAYRLIESRQFVKLFDSYFLFHAIPKPIIYLSRPVLVLAYTVGAVVLLSKNLNRKNSSTILSCQRFMIKWLTLLLGFIFILTICHTLHLAQSFIIKNTVLFYSLNLLQLLSGIGLAGLLISPFFFPAVLYGLPRYPVTAEPLHTVSVSTEALASSPVDENKSPAFESDYLNRIGQNAESCMETHKSYLQPDCNLNLLSKICNIPTHHLSYYFRYIKKQSFNDYRNQWRIEHAKKMIAIGKGSELSLEGIGKSSGFSSRSTFYNAFKKFEGISPRNYMTKHTLL